MNIIQEINKKSIYMREMTMDKGTSAIHWHENIEFIYLLSDGFKIVIDGTIYNTKAGDFVFVGERCIHQFIAEKDNVKMLIGQFPLDYLMNEMSSLVPVKVHVTAEEISKDSVFSKNTSDLMNIMTRIVPGSVSAPNLFAQKIYSSFYIGFMLKFPQDKASGLFLKEKMDFYKTVEFINERFTDDITVQSIAKDLYMSRGRLSKIFVKYSGMTVNMYIAKLRIRRANELLHEGYPVTEAAFECGFQSFRTFSSTYKQIMNVTPSEYISKK